MEYPAEPSKLRPFTYPEEMNLTIPDYYKPGFVDPLYKQYTRRGCEELTLKASPLLRPELIRRNRGQAFQRMFPSDPCPQLFTKYEDMSPEQQISVREYTESDPRGYCFPSQLEFEPVFYTSKSQFYGNVPTTMRKFQDFPQAAPSYQYKDYGYKTPSNPGHYVRQASPYSYLY